VIPPCTSGGCRSSHLLAALEDLEAGHESDPEQLEKWKPGSTSVTLGDGETKSVTLKLTR